MSEAPNYDIEISRVLDAPPESVFRAFTDPDQFAAWYGPDGFPVARESVEIEARVGGRHRFAMVGEADPSMRSAYDGAFSEVVPDEILESSGQWDGIPGQPEGWASGLRVELRDEGGQTGLIVREGPHPPGTAELGRTAWEMMLPKLEARARS
jgi:uncharacterized protein YndB with AHSA1/START domain